MKKFLISVIAALFSIAAFSQFNPQPLNYPGPGYWPFYIEIADPMHVWIGTIQESGEPYSMSVKTEDGGESWIFDSIPVPGTPVCGSICKWDENTCFFVFNDYGLSGGSIWKTTDGGDTWSNMISDQFADSYLNFYHAFSADTGVAMGDPTDDYFEIQLTADGGANWYRVPSSSIPPPLPGEYGLNNAYAAYGNTLWFSTNKGRCYKSADKGSTWTVSQVIPSYSGSCYISFASETEGVLWKSDAISNQIYLTSDGGETWIAHPFSGGYYVTDACAVPGFDGGFVITAYKNFIDVFFTPDLFVNLIKIGSSILSTGVVGFCDAYTGWLSGGESGTNEIYKFGGVLSDHNTSHHSETISIFPNPSASNALLRIPPGHHQHLELFIFNGSGMPVKRMDIPSSADWIPLDASGMANGVYQLFIIGEGSCTASARWTVIH